MRHDIPHPDFDPKKLRIICDFDGTVTPFDMTDAVLARFAPKDWESIEAEWIDGAITARECMERQIALIDAPLEQLNAFLDEAPIVRGFAEFARDCRAKNLEIAIVSDGMDHVIQRILARHGLSDIPVAANRLVFCPPSRYRLEFPHTAQISPFTAAPCPMGVCKCHVAQTIRSSVILIGDGMSDYCLSDHVPFVLARRGLGLEKRCIEKGHAYRPFDDFLDVRDFFDRLLSAADARG